MHRFFCENIPAPGQMAELPERDAAHLFRTLRAAPGEEISLFDGRGGFAVGRVEAGRLGRGSRRESAVCPAVRIHLYCAVPRKQKMDQLLKQLAEIGVWEIVPLLCARSVAQPEEPPERWTALLVEGCKQSWNPFVPPVRPPQRLPAALAAATRAGDRCFFGAVDGDIQAAAVPAAGDLHYFVGPEGGFTREEEAALRDGGAVGIKLAPHILRVETAAAGGALLLQFLAMAK
ncbi:16S rRNA (uracil(1498)-N(3))-methyltransferase [Victivallis sp. Marseille-Q1083]|uniref:RsmE family RNA methyltransferase n=1 Tax=Victivallis sp. Marseille-Q1083 TaxID=2717288 RepID=UPI00158A6678|nr:RsmE family RNA methyltransferase [Victivallis sp. Marseille-Q1083]